MPVHTDVIAVHYHEIALKGQNRPWFESKLVQNIERTLSGVPHGSIRRQYGRVLVEVTDQGVVEEILERLRYVCGAEFAAPARLVDQEMSEIRAAARQIAGRASFDSFAVETRRARKDFSLNSVEINTDVGALIQQDSAAEVDLDNPDFTCHIRIVGKAALIYGDRTECAGGLPVGVSEKAVALLSAGIDSPVAAYKMLTRGVDVIYAHFHSHPYTSRSSQETVEEIVRVLCRHQLRADVHMVPLIAIQRRIVKEAPAPLRVLLYRRAMFRLAARLAQRHEAGALITGESVGQVASQTISNIRSVAEVAPLPVLRPLCGEDKQDIIRTAKAIETFGYSIEPGEDCCSLFVPRHPETKATPEQLLEAEQGWDLEQELDAALSKTEHLRIEADY